MRVATQVALFFFLLILTAGCAKEFRAPITYTAIGTASTFDLNYRDSSGDLQLVSGYPRPWSLSLTGYKSRQYLELRVRPVSNDGSAVCVIAVDGEEVAIAEIKGMPEEAVCLYRLP